MNEKTIYELVQELKEILDDHTYLLVLRSVRRNEKILQKLTGDRHKELKYGIDYFKNLLLEYDKRTGAFDRRGQWFPTYFGKRIWPLDPHVEDIDFRDIFYGLARMPRYNGATIGPPYSVGQHSWNGSYLVPPNRALAVLLHDAHEPYTGDLITPLKPVIGPEYGNVKHNIQCVIAKAAGFEWDDECEWWSKYADGVMLATEVEQLLPYQIVTTPVDYEPDDRLNLIPWAPETTYSKLEQRFNELI